MTSPSPLHPQADRLPDAIFIGPDKAGSTWIANVLSRHPAVYVTPAKDLYFFDREWARGLDWYSRYFRDAPSDALAVEVSHDYLFSADAAARMFEVVPQARLLTCLREPIDRSISAYLYLVRSGRRVGEFAQAIEEYPYLIERSDYMTFLPRYIELFGHKQLYLPVFDDLRRDEVSFADELFGWLGLHPLAPTEVEEAFTLPAVSPRNRVVARTASRASHLLRRAGAASTLGRLKRLPAVRQLLYRPVEREDRPVLDEKLRARLHEYFAPGVAWLGELIDRDLQDEWGYA